MKRFFVLPAILTAVCAFGSGCEKTKQHVRCHMDACRYPYSCPPCPYYERGTKTWRPMQEVYTGVPFPWQSANDDQTRFGTPEADDAFIDE